MEWYFYLIFFLFNMIIGAGLFYSIIIFLFHPYKEKKIFGHKIPLTPGLIYSQKIRIAKYISKLFAQYFQHAKNEGTESKITELENKIYKDILKKLKEKNFLKLLPKSISNSIYRFIADIGHYFVKELTRNFIPELLNRYEIERMIIEFIESKDISIVEMKVKKYATLPLIGLGAGIGLIFSIFDTILLLIIL
ncbi:MAG: hypothetical protein DRH57_04610 [Candidatus Cloacimonadota bacterium]|nr:MAG: hypothetical protein DRH57_04610 [Candidatus Cloacimonadota bacterium]